MNNPLQVIDWNISYMGNHIKKINFLRSLLKDSYCIMLQEVKRTAYDLICDYFSDCTIIYSLDYRIPSRFDSQARRLGVVMIFSPDISVVESGVIERSLFPERTLYATVNVANKLVKILALHSITGCGYLKAKSVQFDTFAEFVDDYQPHIVGMDANEPKIDSNNIYKMEFYNNGKGAGNFFFELTTVKLTDTFVKYHNITTYEQEKPLVVSHKISNLKPVRYDFLFAKNDFEINDCKYLYEEAINASSDHALIVAEFQLDSNM